MVLFFFSNRKFYSKYSLLVLLKYVFVGFLNCKGAFNCGMITLFVIDVQGTERADAEVERVYT